MIDSPLPCSACGTVNPEQAVFCFICGQPLQASATTPNTLTGLLTEDHLLKQRYRILTQIGKGGFGAVYKAADTQFSNRLVAIKEMSQRNLTPQETTEATEAFKREALLLADLRYPNLPRIYDHFIDKGRWYLVMDFIEGATLEEYLSSQQQGRLPPEEVLNLGIQLCNVLGYLHTRQPPIVFRDLKPANIMRTPDQHLYLIDFGIARHFKPEQVKDTMPLGSPGYAAPEQYGKMQTTPRTDIYSLGVTLHQLLTGNDPTRTPFLLAPIQLYGNPALLGLESLIKQMLELDESKRPSSMVAIKQTLQHIADQQTSRRVGRLSHEERSAFQSQVAQREAASSRQKLVMEEPQTHDPKSQLRLSRRTLLVGGLAGLGLLGGATTLWGLLSQKQPIPAISLRPSASTLQPNSLVIYRGHTDQVECIAWAPDSKSIASAGFDKTVQIWDATTGHQILTYHGHTGIVWGVTWSPDGKQIASGSLDKTLQQWSAISGNRIFTYNTSPEAPNDIAWSPNGKYLAVAAFVQVGQGSVQVWDVRTHRMVASYLSDFPYSIAWSPDSKRIAIGTVTATIRVWDVNTGDTPAILSGHTGWLTDVAWSPNGRYLASSSEDGSVRIWEAATGKNIYIFAKHGEYGKMNTVAWSPMGQRIVSGSNNNSAQVWDAFTGDNLFIYSGHAGGVNSAGWSPNGKLIATGSSDHTVRVWRAP